MKATRFHVQNFRNIEDSGWIPLDRVTAFVGRNESGKTALLRALHKFNPATPEPYDPQTEFPRDRYTRDYQRSPDQSWPVCSVEFALPANLRDEIAKVLGDAEAPPKTVIATRAYDGSLELDYSPPVLDKPLSPAPIVEALKVFKRKARRLKPKGMDADAVQQLRSNLVSWADRWLGIFPPQDDLRSEIGRDSLRLILEDIGDNTQPHSDRIFAEIENIVEPVEEQASEEAVRAKIDALTEEHLPVFIYFENYGILDSAIWLPRFLEDLGRSPHDPGVRTIAAMFRHVGLDPNEIEELGQGQERAIREQGRDPTPDEIRQIQRNKEARAIQLNSASSDISTRFSEWWSQRRHAIEYDADGDYLRIWVTDDLRPGIRIELESRSKGFQWFFSFYLVFLVESEEGHRNSVLLLDEPGLNLHPTAQQELIAFFEKLAEKNQLGPVHVSWRAS